VEETMKAGKTANDYKLTDLVTKDDLADIDKSIKHIQDELETVRKTTVKTVVVKEGVKVKQLEGEVFHEDYEVLLKLAIAGVPVLVTGEAGSGKTYSAVQVAKSMGLEFRSLSVGLQTSKTDLLGYMDATGKYVNTSFREMYEKGGVFVMDEIDAGNSNVLIVINSALSNGFASFPDKQVEVHKDFRFIATANTIGKGANTKYVGRNQLDAALLDRFAIIHLGYSDSVEASLLSTRTRIAIKTLRGFVQRGGFETFISTRFGVYLDKGIANNMSFADTLAVLLEGKLPENQVVQAIKAVMEEVQ